MDLSGGERRTFQTTIYIKLVQETSSFTYPVPQLTMIPHPKQLGAAYKRLEILSHHNFHKHRHLQKFKTKIHGVSVCCNLYVTL